MDAISEDKQRAGETGDRNKYDPAENAHEGLTQTNYYEMIVVIGHKQLAYAEARKIHSCHSMDSSPTDWADGP